MINSQTITSSRNKPGFKLSSQILARQSQKDKTKIDTDAMVEIQYVINGILSTMIPARAYHSTSIRSLNKNYDDLM